jgi:aarF domain-containing kinase
MEYLKGVKLVDGIKESYRKALASDTTGTHSGKTVDDILSEHKERMANGTVPMKTLEQGMSEAQRLRTLLLAKDLLLSYNSLRLLYNVSFGLFLEPAQYHWTSAPLDLASMLALLCRMQANTIFEDGVFNGDCHPGNILLLDDGRLGLIDYGQVKKMTIEERVKYAKLIIAHAREDKAEVVRIHFNEMGTKTRKMDPEIGFLMSAFYNDRSTADVCGGKNLPTFIDWLEAKDPMVQLPEQYIMAARVNILLRGMGKVS